MSYFADSDLAERLRGTNVTASSGEIAAARAFAEGYVDAALTGRYVVPFSPVPAVVKYLALDIAAYETLVKHFSVEDPNVGDLIRQFWSRAQETIARLQDGSLRLRDAGGVEDEGAENAPLSTKTSADEVFIEDNW